jgi:hypothetical protein
MHIYFVRDAFERAVQEAERHYRQGTDETGLPRESVAYPLSFIVFDQGPFHPITLSDISLFVVTHAVIPPRRFQDYGSGHARFKGDVKEMNEVFNRMLEAYIDRHPRLDVHSKMHAHPFPGGDHISGGDRKHLIDSDGAKAWRKGQGLSTIILHVMTREEIQGKGLWTIHNFGLDDNDRIVRLPETEIISRKHRLARLALSAAFPQAFPLLEDGWAKELHRAHIPFKRKAVLRGWVMYRIWIGDGMMAFIALNPSFPDERKTLIRLCRGSSFAEILAPEWWGPDLSLLRLVDFLKEK